MFTGIVQQMGTIISLKGKDLIELRLKTPKVLKGVKRGSSVAVNGVCLTVTKIQKNLVSFDVIKETLRVTNLGSLHPKDLVNIETSAKFGDEIGGHIVSGHISQCAVIKKIETENKNIKMIFSVSPASLKYIFHKGFLTLDGCSLTVNKPNKKKGIFSVSLIPETLRATTFQFKKEGDCVNMEIDSITQAVVETILNFKKIT